jgi:LAS superfamily LD-carboxypeptidase LdcB
MGVLVVPEAGAAPAQTDPAKEAKRLAAERETLRKERATQASKINALEANQSEISAALTDLQTNVASQQELLLDAQNSVDEADRQAKEAEKRAEQSRAKLSLARRDLASRAVDSYIYLPNAAVGGSNPESATEMVARMTYLDVVAGNDRDDVDIIRTINEDLAAQLELAAEAKERAQRKRTEVSSRLAELQKAQAEQLGFQESVADRIAAATAEAQGLAAQDEKLSKELVKQQLALAEQLRKAEEERKRREQALLAAKIKAMEEAKLKAQAQERAAAAARDAAASSGGGSSSSGGGGGGASIVGEGSIVSVGGIRVHASIASNLKALLDAAAADGIHFGGGGYRSSAGQIEVRRNNCGSSSYAIYEMPASSCSPPTAKPGSSQHERGLAIDFEANGSTLSRGSAGYRWLKANGAQYGFYNLPSEAWHWSTTGR